MTSNPGQLPAIVERLHAEGLMPPVKAVETAAGGVIRLTVMGTAGLALRAQLAAAMGSQRWNLVEVSDDEAAGVEFQHSDS